MDAKDAIKTAKDYVKDVLSDEGITNVGLEEIEFDPSSGEWHLTVGFSRPWNTPRTRAQEVLENLGAFSTLQRSIKVVTIAAGGQVRSMKDKPQNEIAA